MKSWSITDPGVQTTSYKDLRPDTILTPNSRFQALNVGFSGSSQDHFTPTRFSYSKYLIVSLTGSITELNPNSNIDTVRGVFSSNMDQVSEKWGVTSTNSDIAYQKARADLIDKVRGSIDLSIDLYQIRQTLNSVNRVVRFGETLANTLKKVKRGRASAIKELGSLYLEWTYGFSPTAQTMYETYHKLVTDARSGATLAHFRGRGSDVQDFRDFTSVRVLTYQDLPLRILGKKSQRCQIDIYLKADTTRLQKLAEYTSLNPASWIYENIPYSFVVDYFYNLGGYLRELETAALFGMKFKMGCRTDSFRNDHGTAMDSIAGTVRYNLYGSRVFKGYNRTVLTSFPVPTLPVLYNGLGWRRILNIAALLSQFLPTRKRVAGRTVVFPV